MLMEHGCCLLLQSRSVWGTLRFHVVFLQMLGQSRIQTALLGLVKDEGHAAPRVVYVTIYRWDWHGRLLRTNRGALTSVLMFALSCANLKSAALTSSFMQNTPAVISSLPPSSLSPSRPPGNFFFRFCLCRRCFGDVHLLVYPCITETRSSASSRCRVA